MGVICAFIIIYIFNPIIAGTFILMVVGYTVPKNRRMRNLGCPVCLAATMSYVGYWAHHGENIGDIDRYIIFLNEYKGKPLIECFDIRYSGLYAYDLFQWVCAKFQDERVMVATEVFIIYFVVGYITFSLAGYHNMNPRQTMHCLLLAMCLLPFYNQMSYMRSAIGTSFAILAVYRDLAEHKRGAGTLLCYLAGCMFHQSAWVFVILRVLFPLIKRNISKAALFIFGGTVSMGVGAKLLNQVGGLIGSLFSMANEYAVGEISRTSWAMGLSKSLYNQVNRITFGALLIVCIALITRRKAMNKQNNMEIYQYIVGGCILPWNILLLDAGL